MRPLQLGVHEPPHCELVHDQVLHEPVFGPDAVPDEHTLVPRQYPQPDCAVQVPQLLKLAHGSVVPPVHVPAALQV